MYSIQQPIQNCFYICTAFVEVLIISPVFVGMALATAQLAHHRGYSSRWWFLYGLLLPMISLLILISLKKREKPYSRYHAPVDNTVKDKVLFKREEE
jgi:hypothetical protein